MNNLIQVNLRDPEEFYIACVSSQSYEDFQSIFLHYKKIQCECVYKSLEIFNYHNYEEFKNDRDILENILNNQRVIK